MRVAFSSIKITPKNYVGMPLAGYIRQTACIDKLDNIKANGVLIEESGTSYDRKHILLISLDLLKIPLTLVNYIKKKISDKYKFIEQFINKEYSYLLYKLSGFFIKIGNLFLV